MSQLNVAHNALLKARPDDGRSRTKRVVSDSYEYAQYRPLFAGRRLSQRDFPVHSPHGLHIVNFRGVINS